MRLLTSRAKDVAIFTTVLSSPFLSGLAIGVGGIAFGAKRYLKKRELNLENVLEILHVFNRISKKIMAANEDVNTDTLTEALAEDLQFLQIILER